MDSAAHDSPAPSRRASPIALFAVLVVSFLVSLFPGSPNPLGTNAPPEVFSAGRAAEHIESIASAPRPLGSPAHAAARDRLVDTLEGIGWTTSIESGVGWMTSPDESTRRGARVENIVATRAGTDPTGTVVLAAHYDTVRGSPGAGDNGIGVGTVLETARALGAGASRNDLMVLLTDGEESGLLGAAQFGASDSAPNGPVVVLNHEARGNTGKPSTFRISSPNGALLDALDGSPGANADSLTQVLFEALPNDTDFRRFVERGFHAYDTAIARGAAYYHSPLDTPDRLDSASVQHMGETSLATARTLASSDLSRVADGGDDVVTMLPWGVLHAPRWAEIAAAVALAAMAGTIIAVRLRRAEVTGTQVFGAAVVALVAAGVAAGAAWLPWGAAQFFAPGMAAPVADEPYRPNVFGIAAILAAVGVLVTVRSWWAGRRPVAALTCGSFGLVAVLALLAAPFPGAPTALVLPVLPAALALLVVQFLPGASAALRVAILVAGALPAAVLGVNAMLVSFDAGLMYGAPLAGIFVAVTFAALLPLGEDVAPSGIQRAGGATSAVATVVLVTVCTLFAGYLNRDGATDPRQEYLWYALDADRGSAVWASPDGPRSGWTGSLLTAPRGPVESYLPWRADTPTFHGPAPAAALAPPQVEVLDDAVGGSARELRLRLTSQRGASAVGLWVDHTTATVHGATVDGYRAEPSDDFGFLFWAPGPDGIEVTLTLGMLDSHLGLRIADVTDDLSVVPGYEPPADRVVVQPTVAVARTLRL